MLVGSKVRLFPLNEKCFNFEKKGDLIRKADGDPEVVLSANEAAIFQRVICATFEVVAAWYCPEMFIERLSDDLSIYREFAKGIGISENRFEDIVNEILELAVDVQDKNGFVAVLYQISEKTDDCNGDEKCKVARRDQVA